MVKDGLYHRDLGLPAELANRFVGEFRVRFSDHARRAALNDRYGVVDIAFDMIQVLLSDIVELEVQQGIAIKAVVRLEQDDRFDIVMPIMAPVEGCCMVKTVWLNQANDNHKTLNHKAYQRI